MHTHNFWVSHTAVKTVFWLTCHKAGRNETVLILVHVVLYLLEWRQLKMLWFLMIHLWESTWEVIIPITPFVDALSFVTIDSGLEKPIGEVINFSQLESDKLQPVRPSFTTIDEPLQKVVPKVWKLYWYLYYLLIAIFYKTSYIQKHGMSWSDRLHCSNAMNLLLFVFISCLRFKEKNLAVFPAGEYGRLLLYRSHRSGSSDGTLR